MKRYLPIFRIFLFVFLMSNGLFAQDKTGSFEFDGYTREYQVYLPQNFQPNMPMVLVLHGGNYDIDGFKDEVLIHEIADTAGFITVYPQGITRRWNIGPDSIHSQSDFPDTDDVGFLSALIDTMYARYEIDLARVYSCGHSNGGMMSFRMAGECGQRFAAVASVAGSLFDAAQEWPMLRPLPMVQMHGTGDYFLPYYERDEGYWTVPETIDFWLNTLDCSSQTDTVFFPDIVTEDSSQVEKITWSDCAGENEFIHYKIINAGHAWPGSATIPYYRDNKKNMDISANVELLKFFKKYTNPYVNVVFGKSVVSSPGYMPPSGEMLKLTAEIWNPEQRPAEVYGIIFNNDGTRLDSIQLFDDGLHDDGDASDNFWSGSKAITPGQDEYFKLGLRTRDLTEETTHVLPETSLAEFTSVGPVIIDSYEIRELSNNRIGLANFVLKNNSQTTAIENVEGILKSIDSNVLEISKSTSWFGTLVPGQSKMVSSAYSFIADSNATEFNLILEISSNNNLYWIDSLKVDLTPTSLDDLSQNLPAEFALEQNYPNPFNPTTTIKYSIPVDSGQSSVGSKQHQESRSQHPANVSLVVYDMLGRQVAILVNEQQRPGHYEVKWDATQQASGVYFYKLTAGEFTESKKMLLLR